ncbi:MAG: hypothetical protein CBD16_05590 [Betaproteobacteria bacterium TMED156]|nr:MAG: hypothetical protein CBD16_05590 [Betaproteobacteria bacterium TMED156]
MKLAIDFQGAQASNSERGIGRYCLSIVSELCNHHSTELEIHLLINGVFVSEGIKLRKIFKTKLPANNIHTFFPSTKFNQEIMDEDEKSRSEIIREAVIERIKPDFVLITSLFEGLIDNAVIGEKHFHTNYLTAVILYDLIPMLHPETYLKSKIADAWYQKRIKQLLNFDCVLTISEYTRKTAIENLNLSESKLVNISGAVEHSFFYQNDVEFDETSSLLKKRFGIKKNFIFTVSGIDPRKNLAFLIKSFAMSVNCLDCDYQLVITCNIQMESAERFKKIIEECGLSYQQVIFTGFVENNDLMALYNACNLFVFPSWQEGFGLPVLEAMACGAPVLIAKVASLPEIGGDSVLYFDPFNEASLTSKIITYLNNQNLLTKYSKLGRNRAKLFTWSNVVLKTINALKTKLKQPKLLDNKVTKLRSKPSLLYISPFPPERTGIAEYSASLSKEFTKYYDVTILKSRKNQQNLIKNIKQLDPDRLLSNPKRFERVLYHFGNSHFHAEMFDFVKVYPGVSILHDFFLGGVIGIRPDQYALIRENYGYKAINEATGKNEHIFFRDHPINLSVFQNSFGVIVHSEYSLSLIKKWYGNEVLKKCNVVPLFRLRANKLPKHKARAKLRLEKDKFIVASFGHTGPNKLNEHLLDAWLDSSLSKKSDLFFVGKVGGSQYDVNLLSRANKLKNRFNVGFTDWISEDEYSQWLSAVDIAVQLRTDTRGETSAAALDCLSYSLPTIVNRHGDLASFPKKTVLMIQDNFTQLELREAIEKLYFNNEIRQQLSLESNVYVESNHNIEECCEAYYQNIERFYALSSANLEGIFRKLKEIKKIPSKQNDKLNLAKSISASLINDPKLKKYFVDISELVIKDARSGIQRVVRNVLRCLLVDPPPGYIVEPVYATDEGLGYRKANRFMEQFLNIPQIGNDELIDASRGDVFLGLDLQPKVVVLQKNYFDMLFLKGVSVQFVVYDLIPINYPEFFPQGAKVIFEAWLETICNYDKLISISDSTKYDVEQWIKKNHPKNIDFLQNHTMRLSSELSLEDKTYGDPKNAWYIKHILERYEVFLMVGTVEPRKEHTQVLDAFEMMWSEGKNFILIIVGKKGWCVEDLSKRIKTHSKNNKNLFWIEDCSDEFLMELYKSASGLIAASWAEGYGLPLMEGHLVGLPVFCRDIKVFREIADKFATFFSSTDSKFFVKEFLEWEKTLKGSVISKAESVESICWKKATKELANLTLKNA